MDDEQLNGPMQADCASNIIRETAGVSGPYAYRYEALSMAHNSDEPVEAVINRAELYRKFLAGE